MELGKIITEIRKENNMTQEELAEKFHVTRQTISNWENGKSYPDVEMLVCISNEFNVSLDTMLKGDKDMVKKITREQRQGKKQKKRVLIVMLIVVFLLVGFYFLYNSIIDRTPEQYSVTVKEITLDNIVIDEVNEVATYKDIEGAEYIEEDETKDEGGRYEAPEPGVYVIKGEDYASLMTYGKAYEIVITSDKRIDGYYIGSSMYENALDLDVWCSTLNLLKKEKSNRIANIQFEPFEKIYDGDSVVWNSEWYSKKDK